VATNGEARVPPSLWTDTWRLYEDACLACAGLWTGDRTWRNNDGLTEAERQAHADSPDTDGAVNVRAHGEGIEGHPMSTDSERLYRNAGRHYADMMPPSTQQGSLKDDCHDGDEGQEGREEDAVLRRHRKSRTTLALLQTLHAQTHFWVERFTALLPVPDEEDGEMAVELTPRDVLELELGPLSTLDAQFVEWLAEEYGGGVRVSVRRGWRDVLGLVLLLCGGAWA
jgi:hypothetical protein